MKLYVHSNDDGHKFNQQLTYYIAGPMNGLPGYNYPEFLKAESMLQWAAIKTLNPARIGLSGKEPYDFCLGEALKMLAQADGVILLDGWAGSNGVVQAELPYAQKNNMPIYSYGAYMSSVFLFHVGGGRD